jgi:hypothetical protein
MTPAMEGDNDRTAGLVLPDHHRERDADSNRSRSRWVALVASKEEVMTVADLIEWLKTQDQAATVYVVSHSACIGYYDQGGTAQTVVFDPARHAEHTYYSHLSRDGQPATELLLGVFEG